MSNSKDKKFVSDLQEKIKVLITEFPLYQYALSQVLEMSLAWYKGVLLLKENDTGLEEFDSLCAKRLFIYECLHTLPMKAQFWIEDLLKESDDLFLRSTEENKFNRYFRDDTKIKVFHRLPRKKSKTLEKVAKGDFDISADFKIIVQEYGTALELKQSTYDFYLPLSSYDTGRFLVELVTSLNKLIRKETDYFYACLGEEPGEYCLFYKQGTLHTWATYDGPTGRYSGQEAQVVYFVSDETKFISKMYEAVTELYSIFEVGRYAISRAFYDDSEKGEFIKQVQELKKVYSSKVELKTAPETSAG